MTLPIDLPSLLRRAEGYLDGMTDPTGMKAERDDTRAVLRDAGGDELAEYLELDDALGAAKLPAIVSALLEHPTLAPLLTAGPADGHHRRAPTVSSVVLAKIVCEVANGERPFLPFLRVGEDKQCHIDLVAIQLLAFLANGFNLAWYGEPLVDEEFEMLNGLPSLPSLQKLKGWKAGTDVAPALMAADTTTVANHQRASVKSIIDAHGTSADVLAEQVAKYQIVADGDLSHEATRRFFLVPATRKWARQLNGITGVANRADAVEEILDPKTKAELLRRWLSA